MTPDGPAAGQEVERLRDALDHIARVALRAQTSTRRLDWIVQRAREALAGHDYDPRDDTLPRTRDRTIVELAGERNECRAEREALRAELARLPAIQQRGQ